MEKVEKKQLLVLRTHIYSKRWDELLSELPEKYHVIVVSDQKNNTFEYTGKDTVNFDQAAINNLGLLECGDMQWRFGDYALYLAHFDYKNYDFIWLFEPDVYINLKSFVKFLETFDCDDSDFLCSYFSIAEKDWMWRKYLSSIGEVDAYRTFFPLLRVKKRAVEYLYEQRVLHKSLANDEIFVASKLATADFSIKEFSELDGFIYSKNQFSYRLPHYKFFISNKSNAKIYHPVFDDLGSYFKHLLFKKSWRKVILRLLGVNNKN